jgi:hypothetical protein
VAVKNEVINEELIKGLQKEVVKNEKLEEINLNVEDKQCDKRSK